MWRGRTAEGDPPATGTPIWPGRFICGHRRVSHGHDTCFQFGLRRPRKFSSRYQFRVGVRVNELVPAFLCRACPCRGVLRRPEMICAGHAMTAWDIQLRGAEVGPHLKGHKAR